MESEMLEWCFWIFLIFAMSWYGSPSGEKASGGLKKYKEQAEGLQKLAEHHRSTIDHLRREKRSLEAEIIWSRAVHGRGAGAMFTAEELRAIRKKVHPDLNDGDHGMSDLTAKINGMLDE